MTLLGDITPTTRLDWTSYSGLILHRSCPQAFMYKHLYGLAVPTEADPRVEARFGTMWHALRAADSIERGRALGSLKWAPDTLEVAEGAPEVGAAQDSLVERVLDVADRWGRHLNDEERAQWHERLGEDPGARLWALNERYKAQWAPAREWEQPIAVEVKWVRRLPGSEVDLLGYADEVYYDGRHALVVVRDHKSHKTLGSQTTADDMMDSQLHLYAWGLAEKVKEWDAGPVQAVAYDRVRSVAPKPPVLTTAGRLAVRNGEPSISSCDLHTYVTWAAGEDGKGRAWRGPKVAGKDEYKPGGVYVAEESIIERLSAPGWVSQWFQRTLTPLNRNLVRAHLQAAVDTEKDTRTTLARVARRGEATRNLTGTACRYCDFAALCRAQMIGGVDGEYMIEEYGLHRRPKKDEEVGGDDAAGREHKARRRR